MRLQLASSCSLDFSVINLVFFACSSWLSELGSMEVSDNLEKLCIVVTIQLEQDIQEDLEKIICLCNFHLSLTVELR